MKSILHRELLGTDGPESPLPPASGNDPKPKARHWASGMGFAELNPVTGVLEPDSRNYVNSKANRPPRGWLAMGRKR
jgi:hypothetical protein